MAAAVDQAGEVIERISGDNLAALLQREIRRATDEGLSHVRNPAAFISHAIEVGCRAELVAARLNRTGEPGLASDPTAAFVAGAWHDAGKIRVGDDYHEIAGALDLLERGADLGLVRGPAEEVTPVLGRAAGAILPHFALYEQWHPSYRPTSGCRPRIEGAYRRLADALCPGVTGPERERLLLLPRTIDQLVVMYSDMLASSESENGTSSFDEAFERRWRDIERRSPIEDPGLSSILSGVKSRIYEGCAFVERSVKNT